MSTFRNEADRIIDRAHWAICNAERLAWNATTDASKAIALGKLSEAQRFLARAVAARTAWQSGDHSAYENFPEVPESMLIR
jgi:hypothetical protein